MKNGLWLWKGVRKVILEDLEGGNETIIIAKVKEIIKRKLK